MRGKLIGALAIVMAVLGCGAMSLVVHAEGEEQDEGLKTSLTLTPVSRTLTLASEMTYDGTLSVTNDGSDEVKIEVHASPYSYVYSDEDDAYRLGFNNENNFTQISRWIKIQDKDGNYVENPTFKIPVGETLEINYQIKTPKNIPAGGQYAVIFVQTVSDHGSGGIQTEASAGMIIYGHSTEGEVTLTSEIRDMKIQQGKDVEASAAASADASSETAKQNHNFYASAKVKNTGNVDFFARGKLSAQPIIGFGSYETPDDAGVVSVIPESELVVEDEWAETPDFGLYKVTWTVTAGESSETIEQIYFLISPAAIIITIIVLTFITIGIIIGVRKRKERRSRLAI